MCSSLKKQTLKVVCVNLSPSVGKMMFYGKSSAQLPKTQKSWEVLGGVGDDVLLWHLPPPATVKLYLENMYRLQLFRDNLIGFWIMDWTKS